MHMHAFPSAEGEFFENSGSFIEGIFRAVNRGSSPILQSEKLKVGQKNHFRHQVSLLKDGSGSFTRPAFCHDIG